MIEILTFGNIERDFKRCGVELKRTYTGSKYNVYEVSEEELKSLQNDLLDADDAWVDCGWVYSEIANADYVEDINKKVIINDEVLIAWYNDEDDDEDDEEFPEYEDLLTYLCDEMGCSLIKNIYALSIRLANANNIKLSELFNIYQG